MTQISDRTQNLQRQKQAEIEQLEVKQKLYRPSNTNVKWDDFIAIFKENIKISMKRRNAYQEFVFDEHNKRVITQLYYHLTLDTRFEGDLQKGIYLYGKTGRGKSTILDAYSLTIRDFTERLIVEIHAKELAGYIIKFGYDYFDRRPIKLDDAGREAKEVTIFGNKTIPMMEIIQRRELYGAFTLATSQVRFCDIKFSYWSDGQQKYDGYGEATIRRARILFNEIELTGPDRTK